MVAHEQVTKLEGLVRKFYSDDVGECYIQIYLLSMYLLALHSHSAQFVISWTFFPFLIQSFFSILVAWSEGSKGVLLSEIERIDTDTKLEYEWSRCVDMIAYKCF